MNKFLKWFLTKPITFKMIRNLFRKPKAEVEFINDSNYLIYTDKNGVKQAFQVDSLN